MMFVILFTVPLGVQLGGGGRVHIRHERLRQYFRSLGFWEKCFGKLLGVKPSWLSYLHYQNPPKTFRIFRKVLAANLPGKQA